MKKKTKLFLIAGAILFLLLLLLFIIGSVQNNYRICFFNGDEGGPIDGKVFLEGKSLGDTLKGCLDVEAEKYSEGKLTIMGEYKGRIFEQYFIVLPEDLDKLNLDYVLDAEDLEKYELSFFKEDLNKTLDGEVYLNNKKLGETTDGTLTVKLEQMFPGTVTLNMSLEGESYEFYFEFSKEDLVYYGKNFYVKDDDLAYIELDPSKLNEDIIAENVVSLINTKRNKEGLDHIKMSDKLSKSAFNYLKKVVDSNFDQSYITPAINTLSKDGIFSFYAIGVDTSKDLTPEDNENSVAAHIVDKLFEDVWSKGELLGDYSETGVGVYSIDKRIYVLAFLSITEYSVELNAIRNTCSGLQAIYNQALPYDKDIKINFKLNSTESTNAYIITDEKEQNRCINRKSINSIKSYIHNTNIDDEIVIPKGAGLMIETTKDIDYKYTVKFVSWG